jgi:hypothetical protein
MPRDAISPIPDIAAGDHDAIADALAEEEAADASEAAARITTR